MKRLSNLENSNKRENMGNQPQQRPPSEQSTPPAFNIPTETVQLPSKGLLYPQGSELSSGTVEIKHMTAREEDIIGTETYIKNNTVIEKLLTSLIQSPIKYNDLLLGDRNAIMMAARIYGYGPDYEAEVKTPSGTQQKVSINLSEIEYKEIDEKMITPGSNLFKFKFPISGDEIEFKVLTVGDEKKIERAIKERKKTRNGPSSRFGGDPTLTTRLEAIIQKVNGQEIQNKKEYVQNILARDSKEFRKFYAKIQPDVDLEMEFFDEETGEPFRSQVPLGPTFLYPEYEG